MLHIWCTILCYRSYIYWKIFYLTELKLKSKSHTFWFCVTLFWELHFLISHAKFYLCLVFSLIINPITKPADNTAKLNNKYSIKSPHLLKKFHQLYHKITLFQKWSSAPFAFFYGWILKNLEKNFACEIMTFLIRSENINL